MATNQTPTTASDRTSQTSQSNQNQDKQAKQQNATSSSQQMSRRQENRVQSSEPTLFGTPFTLLQRFFTEDVTSLLDQLSGRQTPAPSRRAETQGQGIAWMPRVDVFQRGNELVVRADLPGMKPDEVAVEIGEDTITISGQRQQEHREEDGGVYRFERVYGSFFREIPLPPGVITDQAKASFKDGVLEITVPAPPEQVSRGRRVEVTQSEESQGRNRKEGSQ